jgi:hypothetical protein
VNLAAVRSLNAPTPYTLVSPGWIAWNGSTVGQCWEWLVGGAAGWGTCGTGGMTWPGAAGIAVYAGSNTWGTSLVNSTNGLYGITETGSVPGLTALGTAATQASSAFQAAITGSANQVFGGAGPGMISLTSSYLPLTAMGTITGGVWNGTALTASYVPAIASLTNYPLTTAGDVFIGGASGAAARLADVATGQVLASGGVGVAPSWTSTPTFTATNVTGLPLTGLASQGSATMIANVTSGSAAPTAVSIPAAASLLGTGSYGTPAAATGHAVAAVRMCADSSGSATAQSCTTSPSFTPSTGDELIYTTTTANTGALTVNVNSTSAYGVYKWGGAAAVVSGDIPANKPIRMTFDGANHWDVDDIGNAPSGSGMTWPGAAGIAVYAGSNTWGTSLVNSTNGLYGITETGSVPGLTALGTAATQASSAFQAAITGSANQVFGGAGPGMISLTSSYLPLTAMGTITGGVWNGTALTASYVPAIASLTNYPLTTAGDVFIGGASGAAARLADVATGQVLASGGVGVAPSWTSTPTFTATNVTGLPLTGLASQGSATMIANVTSGSAAPTAVSIPAAASLLGTGSYGTPAAATGHAVAAVRMCADSSGSATAQSCTTSPSFTPSTGDELIYTTTTANTGALTVNVNSTSAYGVYKWGGAAAVVSGDIPANKPIRMTFDGANHWDVDDIGNAPSGSGMTWPGAAGIAVYAGSNTWGTSLVNSTNGLYGITETGSVPGLTALGTAATQASSAFQAAITGSANQVFGGAGPGMISLTSSYLPLTAMGTITGGVWNGTALTASYVPAIASLTNYPLTTAGDVFIGGASGAAARLADVATGQVLASGGVGVAPSWTSTPTFTATNVTGLPLTGLASQGSATMIANVTSGSAAPTAVSIPAAASLLGTGSYGTPAAATGHAVAAVRMCADSSGSATAQSCTTSPSFTPSTGDELIYTTTTANTGALTVNVNSTSAYGVYKWGGAAAVVSGDIPANKPIRMTFDGANHWDVDDIGNAPSGSGLNDPGANGLIKRTALNTTAPAVANTDYVGPTSLYYNFSALSPGGSLSVGSNTVTLLGVCPFGVNGSDTNHYLYISGGNGTAEAVLLTGGTATAGNTGGTLIFTAAYNHTGVWTITSATSGIQEDIVATNLGRVWLPAAQINVYATIYAGTGIDLVGQDRWATNLVRQFSGAAATVTLSSANIYNVGFAMASSLTATGAHLSVTGSDQLLQNLRFNDTSPSQCAGYDVYFNSAYNYSLDSVQTYEATTASIYHTGGSSGFISNWYSSSTGTSHIDITWESGYVDGTDWSLQGTGSSSTGISITPGSGHLASESTISNLTLDSFAYGIVGTAGSGAIDSIAFTNIRSSVKGITMLMTGPAINDILVSNVSVGITSGNTGPAFRIDSGQGFKFDAITVVNGTGATTYSGFLVNVDGGPVINFSLRNSKICVLETGLPDTGANNAVLIGNTTSSGDRIVVQNNHLGAATPLYSTSTGAHQVYDHNMGVDDVVASVSSAAALALPISPNFILTGGTGATSITSPLRGAGSEWNFTVGASTTFTAGTGIGNTITITKWGKIYWDGTKAWISGV